MIKNYTIKWTAVVSVFLTIITYAIGLHFNWIENYTKINVFEAIAIFTSYWCTLLCNVQTRWNYPIGAVSTLAYSIVFYQGKSYALALFNLYLVFSLTYGYFFWKDDKNTRPVTSVSQKEMFFLYIPFTLLIGITYLIIMKTFDVKDYNLIDIGLAALSGTAQLMLDRKKVTNWLVWVAVNVVSVYYFFYVINLPFIAVQYVFFLPNAFVGYMFWKKSMAKGI